MERTITHDSHYASSLIEASLDPLITIDIYGKITDMNQAKVDVTGVDRNKLIGANFYDYFTNPEEAKALYLLVFEEGTIKNKPLTFLHANGKLTDVLFNGSVYRDSNGNVLGAVVVARDIAEQKLAEELITANKALAFQNDEKEKRAAELIIANKELVYYNDEKEKRAAELIIANKELVNLNDEKEKRAAELIVANKELVFLNDEKEKRAAELIIANKALEFQNDEKEKRAAELIIANKELAFQNDEKEKRAAELIIANKALEFQNDEKEKRAAELIIANKELAFQNDEKEKRAAELIIANKALAFQNDEKEKRAAELIIANKELVNLNDEKEKRAAELILANKELIFQNEEKEKRAAELKIADKELVFQTEEKEKRAAELIIADKELVFQTEEKEKRAAELIIADKELVFQTEEKEKRAAELIIADIELEFQNEEKEKRETANKDLEELSYSLKLVSQYARSLIEASLDPLFTINPLGKITDMNNASVNITGVSREKLIGTDFFDYFTEPQKARQVYQEVFAKGFVANYPLTMRDGKLTDVLFNGSVYKDEKGSVLGAVVVARDITEQKRVATELNEAIVFAEMATEIAETAKNKAESATLTAENAVKAKQQFLSNMSHEIRTPMNAIIGFTKVLLKTDLSAKQNEYLTAIKLSGDALIVLINDILDLAKVDAGKMNFEQVPFKMSVSIAAMLHLFESKIWEKNLMLIKEYDDKIPEVLLGDPVRLHQIILNLVSNAVKFTSKGAITVSVRLLEEDDEKVTVEFAVADTGIGIPEAKIDKIFENFQQASSGTSRLYGGTGLGLAIVKQLVEPQGGKIVVTSKVDEGSVFSFTLCFHKTNEEAETVTELENTDSEINNVNVLVVEDIPLNQLLMKTLLDDFGFERDIAANGKIAIERLKAKSYDVILMDLQMPEMNGFEATDYIRNVLNSNIPIIALTADVTTVDLAKCRAVGMNDYIAKPVDERLLYSKIVSWVKKPSPVIELKKVEEPVKIVIRKRHTDLEYLNTRTKSNPKLMMEMISLYLEQTPTLITAMNQSLENEDWLSLHAAVHKMIPSFSIMGMSIDLENIAKKVQEFATNQEKMEEIKQMVAELASVCVLACNELKDEFDRIKNENNE
jgi:PAS domain S-box-containing protein